MKRSYLALLCLLAAATAAWFLSSPIDSSTAQAKDKPPKEYRTMTGMLSAVDVPARSIIVSNADVNRKFDVAADAEILRNGAPCSLEQLKKGNVAAVSYIVETGKKVAHRIVAQATAPVPQGHGKQETRPAAESSAR